MTISIIESVWLNCDDLTSSYQVTIALANTLLSAEEALPKAGLPKSQVYETMFEALDGLGTTDESVRDYVLIVLDEIDNISSHDRMLYQIPRARANDKVEQVWPAVIGISNDVTFKENLSAKVKSSLCEREIVFTRYDAVQLAAIIRQRVDIAFTEGAVGEDVIQLCAAYAVREGGVARYALDLLKVAADTARDRGDATLTEADLDTAREQVEDTRILTTKTLLTYYLLDLGDIWPVVVRAAAGQTSVWEICIQTDDTPCGELSETGSTASDPAYACFDFVSGPARRLPRVYTQSTPSPRR